MSETDVNIPELAFHGLDDHPRGRACHLRPDPGGIQEDAWIQGSNQRFSGYNFFSEHPEVAVDRFDAHIR